MLCATRADAHFAADSPGPTLRTNAPSADAIRQLSFPNPTGTHCQPEGLDPEQLASQGDDLVLGQRRQRHDDRGYGSLAQIRLAALANSPSVVAWRRSPTPLSAFPAHARAWVPSRTIPHLKQARTVYQSMADRSRVLCSA